MYSPAAKASGRGVTQVVVLQLCVLTVARPGGVFIPEPFAVKSVVEL